MTPTTLGLPTVRRDPAATPDGMPVSGPLLDTFGRVATDLRVSLTDRCNLRCSHCMPAEGLDWLPGSDLLSFDELSRLLRLAVTRLGITNIRRHRRRAAALPRSRGVVAAVAALAPRPNIAMTTNGVGLARRAAGGLAAAGLDRVNVSLDTIDRAHFTAITRRDRLGRCSTAWPAAAAGLGPVKVNAVLDPVTGPGDAVELLRFCLEHGYQLRIIEQMPLDGGHQWSRDSTVPADDIVAALRRSFDLRADPTPRGSARRAGRRRTGDGGDHRLGVRRVLLGLRPDPADRRRAGAQLSVRERGERPARTAAVRRRRCRTRVGVARGDVAQGGRARDQRSGLRAAEPPDERDRRLNVTEISRSGADLPITVRFLAAAQAAAGAETGVLNLRPATTADAVSELCGQSDKLALVLQKCSFLCATVWPFGIGTLCCTPIRLSMFCRPLPAAEGDLGHITIRSRRGHGLITPKPYQARCWPFWAKLANFWNLPAGKTPVRRKADGSPNSPYRS